MTLPEIADRLRELARSERMPELARLAEAMRRRPRRRGTAPISSQRVTPELRAKIRAYARAHPDLSQARVARVFNVNPGRVSESLSGKRK